MSTGDNSNVTSFRWKIVDLSKQRDDANPNGLTSKLFSLQTRSSIQFVLFVSPPYKPGIFEKNAVSVILKQFDNKPFEASVKLWIESTEERKFGETFVEKHAFDKIGDQFGYNGFSGKDYTVFYALYDEHKTFYICCEIVDLNASKLLNINCDPTFHQNQWALYENETFCDAIIKVGKKEFKVSKFIFASQSQVFKSMFESKFKEGVTSIIEVKDADETMKHLVKWLYTSKLEYDAPIEKLFTTADKYDIKLLKTICVQLMINSLSESNAFQRLVLSNIHSNNELKSAALEFISKLSKRALVKIFASDQWAELKNKNQAMAKDVEELICNKLD